ncbi:hypothetical protein C4D60_Mb06t06330 [Musa balbisiana]|uniref:Major facilitator superfamily (MFS) profile domain-containing protein n=1 Tax=Musa balbisiana TaxID=52838 RepID=A0A4S8INH4_MUSBA|nr:hypothetical protein C4D60_Mb06t06330 [Musa balbisiana]
MSWSVADAVDYKRSPADRTKTGGWIPALLILVIEICERLSTLGIGVNLVTYLSGTMNLRRFLADSYLGRYLTVAIFAVVQAFGTGMLTVVTKLPQLRPPPCGSSSGASKCQRANGFQIGLLYLSLYLIALGTGGLKSSVSGFGTDQFDEKDEKEKSQKAYFFNRFFFFISTGSLLAVTVLVYIQDEVGRSWSYGICCISMLLAIVLFLSGTRRYRFKKRSGSPIVHILQVLVAAFRKRQLNFLDKAAIGEEFHGETSTMNPWRLCSVTRVEEVKMMIQLLPVWATTIMFWTIYAQMMKFSVEQATTMDRSVGSFKIPAGSLNVFFVSAILITLAIYDRVIMPAMKKWKGKQAGFTNLQRIGLGLTLSIMAMASTALTEVKRLSVAREAGKAAALRGAALPITVFTLVPQFFLVGSGEALTYTGQLDFFITRSPKGMKTMSTGLFLTTLSLGFFLSSFIVSIVKSVTGGESRQGWLADNINHGRLDYFYGLLAALSTLNLAAFLYCATWIKPENAGDGLEMATAAKNSPAEDKC